jgi:hypothetical protein
MAASADRCEPAGAAESGDRAEPADAAEPAGVAELADRCEPVDTAASADRGEPDAAEPPVADEPAPEPAAAVAGLLDCGGNAPTGIVASFGPKSVGSNKGDVHVPEYAESTGAVVHDPDGEASGAGDPDVMLPAAFAAGALEFFAAKAVVLAAGAGAALDGLAELALPPGLAAPGRTVGMPNPAGEIGFRAGCVAGVVTEAGAGVAA